MDKSVVDSLVGIFNQSELTHLEYQDEKIRLVLKKEVSGYPPGEGLVRPSVRTSEDSPVPFVTHNPDEIVVCSPIVGTLYSAREPGLPPLVSPGQEVSEGDVLCLIEAMKMFSEVKAPCDGVVVSIGFENGQVAEFDMPLFVLIKKHN